MEDTPMENTLDAVWDGEIAWIVGLCIAAVKAGQTMAEEMNDTSFAQICADYVKKGVQIWINICSTENIIFIARIKN